MEDEDERNIFCQGLWHLRSWKCSMHRSQIDHPQRVSPPQQIESSPLEGQSRFQTCSSSCSPEVAHFNGWWTVTIGKVVQVGMVESWDGRVEILIASTG